MAAGFAREIAGFIRSLPNERGANFQANFFVYYAFRNMAVDATPDGRHAGDPISQGVAPHREGAPAGVTDVLRSLSRIDFRDFPGNAVLDLQLPAGDSLPPAAVSALIRSFARVGGPTLQLNCVSAEILRDAQQHPERHASLVVRISGLSAAFVQLNKSVQDEIISRAVVGV